MSFKQQILSLILLGIPLLITAQKQETASLSGKVTDAQTGEILIGASVLLQGTYKGASTDINGQYVINGIKPNNYAVKVQYIGYKAKLFTSKTFEAGENKTLNVTLEPQRESLNEVTVVGRKGMVDLEEAASAVSISQEEISQMNVRDVQEVVNMQAGVTKTQDGLQIRGARVYETEYLVDGISAQDPLAGTGFGLDVNSQSLGQVEVITGGAGAEFGGSSGVVNTQIREGGEKFEISGTYQTDHLGPPDAASSFNTDRMVLSLSTPIPGTQNKLSLFTSGSVLWSDNYFGPTADQLRSSLFENQTRWAPRQRNSYTHTVKLAYQIKSGTKLTLTNQHSLNVNQNSRTLQIVGFDAILRPGFQYNRSNNLDNATTYTHHSNLTALNLKHLINKRWGLSFSLGRLFTNLRADANGRPFRTETVDQILDEDNITTSPVEIFNPNDPSGIYYVSAGNGLVNNGGISPVWHDHYASEYTLNAKASFIPNEQNEINFGVQSTFKGYQWVDVSKPWVGAPIQLNDSTQTVSQSIGASNDIWAVNPIETAFYVQDRITYKGIRAQLGLRFAMWAPGSFADDAVNNPDAPVIDQVRKDYKKKTFGLLGLRWKARLLPKINVSFPVTENNVLYFNYGHNMRLPHPRFLYAGLDPTYQDRSFLSSLGNPDVDPEVNVSYEIGLKSRITPDLALTATAFNNNRFDYIVSRRVLVEDQTGRPVSKTFYINQDYAKIYGLEVGLNYRYGRYLRTFGNVAYQVARGKSNSARESALQIEQNGEVSLTREQFLAFDRPWNVNLGVVFTPDSTLPIAGLDLTGFRAYLSYQFTSGYRYTPQRQTGVNDQGRTQYEPILDQYLQGQGTPWNIVDLKLSYKLPLGFKGEKGLVLSLEVRNLLDAKNAQIINPVTGRAYEYGDPVPLSWRDPRFNGPQERGVDPRNPARYLQPRQILYGLQFRF
ncbi:MAG: TonB-dependent receptor [Schleiferiaceae bacterium]|nr:TonB-dependent receptor [Schleiferiaceae bacterium]MDR9441197.1 TonB-dependent receptor [Schleiferiaceae bacterium]